MLGVSWWFFVVMEGAEGGVEHEGNEDADKALEGMEGEDKKGKGKKDKGKKKEEKEDGKEEEKKK
jgi:hypothetical protein